MQIKIFVLPVFDTGQMLEEMNRFLRGHNVVKINEELVSNGSSSAYWCYSIHYLPRGRSSVNNAEKKPKIDYREVLDGATFRIYARLRDCRKEIGEQVGVPLYAVFTNAELAKIAALPELLLEHIKEVEGVGKGKLEKYGSLIIEKYNQLSKE